jgi:hypothetical protein
MSCSFMSVRWNQNFTYLKWLTIKGWHWYLLLCNWIKSFISEEFTPLGNLLNSRSFIYSIWNVTRLWHRFQVLKNTRNNHVLPASCYDVCLHSRSHHLHLIQFALQQKHCNSVKVSIILDITLTFIGRTGTPFPVNVTYGTKWKTCLT